MDHLSESLLRFEHLPDTLYLIDFHRLLADDSQLWAALAALDDA
jgi:hypothetical protein